MLNLAFLHIHYFCCKGRFTGMYEKCMKYCPIQRPTLLSSLTASSEIDNKIWCKYLFGIFQKITLCDTQETNFQEESRLYAIKSKDFSAAKV